MNTVTRQKNTSKIEKVRYAVKSTFLAVGRKDEASCMEARLREIEAVEARIYGGLTFVPEGDK